MSRAEFIAAAVLFALMIVFKVVNMLRYRLDSDESQHMHVVWAWARGFVQYRDIFDNHMPLFHIMFAPIFGLIGDRPTILYWMRFILLPMYSWRLGALTKLGRDSFPGVSVSGQSCSRALTPVTILLRSNFEPTICGRLFGCCVSLR